MMKNGTSSLETRLDSLKDSVRHLVDMGGEKAGMIKDKAIDAKDVVARNSGKAVRAFGGLIKDHPIAAIGIALEALSGAVDDRQRRAKLVRGDRHEAALLRRRLLEILAHLVEGVDEDPNLTGRADIYPCRKIAGGKPGRRGCKLDDRLREFP